MAALYLVFLSGHFIIAAMSYLPSIDPNEFSVSAMAAYFSGSDWSAAMTQNSYFYGFLQAALYTPVMLATTDPFLSYTLMIGINGIILSLIPVIAYSLSLKIGAKKPWQAGLVALVCGGYSTFFAHGNFIWNETLAMFLPWLLAWLMFSAYEKSEGKKPKFFRSVILGAAAALSYAAHARLFAIILALILTLIFARAFLKQKIVRFIPFFISFGIVFVLQYLASYGLQQALWNVSNPALISNTPENFFATVGANLNGAGFARFIQSLIGQLWYFLSSTWGFGALAMTIFVFVMFSFFSRRKSGLFLEYSNSCFIFSVFTALSFVFMLFIGCCYKFTSDFALQDSLIFGRYLDSVSPFAIMLVLVFIFIYGIKLRHIVASIGVHVVFTVSFATAVLPTLLLSSSTRMSPILAIYPLLIGQNNASALSFTSFLATASCPLCVLVLMIILTTCAGSKVKSFMTAVLAFIITAYSTIFVAATYIPASYAESVAKNEIYINISEYIYNQSEAPSVTVYKTSRNVAQMLQFINRNVTVHYAGAINELVEESIVVVPKSEIIRFSPTARKITFTKIATVGDYEIYAYGERALAYIESQKQ